MEKQLILSIDQSHICGQEEDFFLAFTKNCAKEGFYIAKETEATVGERHGLFCIAICDSQEAVDVFLNKKIPVVAYEYDDKIRLNNAYIIQSFEGVDTTYLTKVHHRFFGLPLQIMETKRTLIREFSMEDLDALFHLYEGPHITDYMEPLYPYEEEKAYEETYIKNVYGLHDYGMWLVVDKASGEIMGRAGIETRGGISGVNKDCFEDDRSDGDTVELGYLIREDFQKKGYATEVCQAIVDYAFSELGKKRIYAQVDEKNEISKKLLKKLGFEYKGAELFEIIH